MLFEQPRIFALVPGSKTTAAYVTIANNSGGARVLLSVVAGFAEKAEIHDTINDNGIAKMRPLSRGLPIADGESATLAAGGKHFMFVNITSNLTIGDKIPLVLFFADEQLVTVNFLITKRGENTHDH